VTLAARPLAFSQSTAFGLLIYSDKVANKLIAGEEIVSEDYDITDPKATPDWVILKSNPFNAELRFCTQTLANGLGRRYLAGSKKCGL